MPEVVVEDSVPDNFDFSNLDIEDFGEVVIEGVESGEVEVVGVEVSPTDDPPTGSVEFVLPPMDGGNSSSGGITAESGDGYSIISGSVTVSGNGEYSGHFIA